MSDLTRSGIENPEPDRTAVPGGGIPRDLRRRKRRRGERLMVPEAEFTSYYGRAVLKEPTWEPLDIAGYLFLGGLAGGSSLLGAGADLTGRPALARASKIAALGSVGVSLVALVHDLGRPLRFVNMLRTFKPTSPMSVGTWLLSSYAPLAGASAVSAVTGRLPAAGRAAGLGAAITGAGVASYTAVLISDTAVPSWHEGFREMPFVFVGSAAAASGGFGMIAAPLDQAAPARRAAIGGAALELAASQKLEKSVGLAAETLRTGTAGTLMKIARAATGIGAVGAATVARRSRIGAAVSGAALLVGSACTRFGIFHAGVAAAKDPKYTVVPQRERLDKRDPARAATP